MDSDEKQQEVCVVVAGSIDAGKSTFLGVLANNELDDGNGKARSSIAKHPHEVDSGRTSDISIRTVTLMPNKETVLVDLCGHKKYLKTTLFGITGYFPDYGVLIVAANRGVLQMTKEHHDLLIHMKIPFVVLVTRIDIAPDEVYKKTLRDIQRLLKPVNKKGLLIKKSDKHSIVEAVKICARNMKNNTKVVPVLCVSNKTGENIDGARILIANLEPRTSWTEEDNSTFYIDSSYTPKGVGLVVAGTHRGEPIRTNDDVYIGPYMGDFVKCKVRSIHDNNRNEILQIDNSHRGCLAIRVVDKKVDFTRQNIKKGMVIVKNKEVVSNICYEFRAQIQILHHSTTISRKFNSVIHCGTVRQTAKIILEDNENLKTGDIATVRFRFMRRPEYIEPGLNFFFREGMTRGVGQVIETISLSETAKNFNHCLEFTANITVQNGETVNYNDEFQVCYGASREQAYIITRDKQSLEPGDSGKVRFRFRDPKPINKDMTFTFINNKKKGAGQVMYLHNITGEDYEKTVNRIAKVS